MRLNEAISEKYGKKANTHLQSFYAVGIKVPVDCSDQRCFGLDIENLS